METLVEVLRKIAPYSPETKAEFEKLKKQSGFLGNMDTEHYEQLSRKYTEEYYTLKAEEVKIC